MKTQNNKNKIKKERETDEKKGEKMNEIKTYYEAESWMFSGCGH